MALWKKVLLGSFLGFFFGLFLGEQALYFKPLGDLFIRSMKMVIVPLVFFAIVGGVTGVQDRGRLGRIGLKALLAYVSTGFLASFIAVLVSKLIQPGVGLDLDLGSAVEPAPQGILTFIESALEVVPDNFLGAMAQGHILQVVFFSFFTGFVINTLEKEIGEKIVKSFYLGSQLIFKMVYYIVQLSPLAAFGFMAWIVGTQGPLVLGSLAKLIGSAYLAFFFQYIIFGVILYGVTKLNPWLFYKKSLEYQTIAFSTSSSKAALPTTMKVCEERLGVSKMSSSFILPLGASVNMDGITIYLTLCAMFLAQATGKVLALSHYAMLFFTTTVGAIGAAGIPSGTIIMLPVVLEALGLPLEGIALIAGVDRVIDMARTTISITGDAMVTFCLDHHEGLLDKSRYLDPDK